MKGIGFPLSQETLLFGYEPLLTWGRDWVEGSRDLGKIFCFLVVSLESSEPIINCVKAQPKYSLATWN